MTIIKTRLSEPKMNNRFRVTIAFEHGDADQTTYDTSQFKGWSDQDLLDWIAKFRQYATAVNEMRWYSKPFNRDEVEQDLGIELESDCVYDSDYNYVAAMSIDKIEWVDNEGIVYSVTGY